jgi:hypothetical protein
MVGSSLRIVQAVETMIRKTPRQDCLDLTIVWPNLPKSLLVVPSGDQLLLTGYANMLNRCHKGLFRSGIGEGRKVLGKFEDVQKHSWQTTWKYNGESLESIDQRPKKYTILDRQYRERVCRLKCIGLIS